MPGKQTCTSASLEMALDYLAKKEVLWKSELLQPVCPKSKQRMSVSSFSLKILHVSAGRQPLV